MNTAKRTIGIIIIAILLGLASQGAKAAEDWVSFVVHVRQGPVDGPVVGGDCTTETTGCARRVAAPPAAWLDGECWITVRDWDTPITREVIVNNWGHELAHCVGKSHDEEGNWNDN